MTTNITKGSKLIIEAKNSSSENRYIQSVTFNGKDIEKFWISHSEIVTGGELVFNMGPEPNKEWAVNSEHPQVSDSPEIVTTPYITETKKVFLDDDTVKMACDTQGAEIYYTLDNTEPSKNSSHYLSPFIVDKTTTIKMVAYRGEQKSLCFHS